MADNSYGVYISIRNTDGVLVSASRATADEVLADLDGLMTILDRVSETEGEGTPEPTMNAEQVQYALGGNQAPVPVQYTPQQQPTAAPVAQPVVQGNFDTCNKCGTGIKDKWVGPGVSKRTGKAYPGFFGCNNPNCR